MADRYNGVSMELVIGGCFQGKLAYVKEKLAGNEENIRKLTENLSEDNLAKTRAFADMIAASPSILNDTAELNRIKER